MAAVNKKAPKMKQKKNRLCTKATINAMQGQFQTRGRGGGAGEKYQDPVLNTLRGPNTFCMCSKGLSNYVGIYEI